MTLAGYAVTVRPDDNGTLLITCRDIEGVATFSNDTDGIIPIAQDAIMVLLSYAIEMDQAIPTPTPPQKGEVMVPLPVETQQKILLYLAMRARGWTMQDMARALRREPTSTRRLFDLHRKTAQKHLNTIAKALGLVGIVTLVPQGHLTAVQFDA